MYQDIKNNKVSSNYLQLSKEKLDMIKEAIEKNEDKFNCIKDNYKELLPMQLGMSTLLLTSLGILNLIYIPYINSHIEYINSIKYLSMFDTFSGVVFILLMINELKDFMKYKEKKNEYLERKASLIKLETETKEKIKELENKQVKNSDIIEYKNSKVEQLENLKKELECFQSKEEVEKNKQISLKIK